MSVSAQQLRKIYSRRRVVAINFLSNISLDGSPTKKDVVRQRMVRCAGNNWQGSQAKHEEQPSNGAELICCELHEGEKNEQGKERSNTCSSDCKHNRASTYDQSSSPTAANNPRQRTSSGQVYARSVSSQEAEQQLSVANPNSLSMKSFISPGGGMKLQTSTSVERRSDGAGGGEAISVMSLANAVGSRLKAQLTKMDGDVTCSFDALRAFGLVRTTDKKTVISFGSLLTSSALPKSSKQPTQPLMVARASGGNGETTRHPVSPLPASGSSRSEATSNAQLSITPKSDRSLATGTQSQLTVPWSSNGASINKVPKQGVSSHGAGVEDASASPSSVSYSPTIFDEMVVQSVARAARLNSSQNELKRMMNEQLRLRFPSLQITLSKLQSLKRELAQVARKCALEPAIVACAYVFFEKLVLSALIRKDNRKPCCGACLLLSAKLNDVRDEPLTTLIKELEQTFRIARRELLAYEVAILVALEFNLNVPLALVRPHYLRLVDAN